MLPPRRIQCRIMPLTLLLLSLALVTADEWRFAHADMLGTTRLVTDEDGYIGTGASTPGGAAIAYSAFGEILGQAHPGGTDARSRYGYCGGWGYQNDALEDPTREIGMLHVGARYLEPALGRFLQRDPIAIDGGLNVYAYCLGNPCVGIDPDGLTPLGDVSAAAKIGIQLVLRGMMHTVKAALQLLDKVSTVRDFLDIYFDLQDGGFEWRFSKDFRIGWHNVNGKKTPEWLRGLCLPHFHKRGVGGIGRHRPWDR